MRTIKLSATRVSSVMKLRKRSKRDKTSFNILNTFSQQTHNKLEFFTWSGALCSIIQVWWRGGWSRTCGSALQTLSRMRPHGGGDDGDDDNDSNNNDNDDDDDD